MMPISSYKELIQSLDWDTEKRTKERWYVFLVMNPWNQTNAGADIIRNFSYLDVRSGNVTIFLPGFSNMNEGVVPYQSPNGNKIYEDESFGEIYFDQDGFLKTIRWLEKGSGYTYRYSEDLDLVIVKYHPNYILPDGDELYEQNFDLHNLIAYNLDDLKRDDINTIRMVTECRKAVAESETEWEVRQKIESFISRRAGDPDRHWRHLINVFVAGSKTLKTERDAVISALTHITNNSSGDYVFRVKTYEDFGRSLSNEGRQEEYNRYISNDADYAVFILDSTVGGITFEEFEVAMKAYQTRHKPEIYVYSHSAINKSFFGLFRRKEQSEEVTTIRNYLSEIRQYYIEYRDIDDLKNNITHDFRRYGL